MLPPIIRIDNIVKKYGPLTVLDGLSMNVMRPSPGFPS